MGYGKSSYLGVPKTATIFSIYSTGFNPKAKKKINP